MRLTSITVRNYRLHRELTAALDPSLTLIAGPNESGKSTLMEAAHRALFLRARTGGETQRSMLSRFHRGHPEVEVGFESGGRTFLIAKRFSGTSGTATLTELGGATLHGDEAETRLADLLGVEVAAGGKRSAQQWAHLWVRQGDSAGDPIEYANDQRDSLLARLRGSGGAAAMQSELDARVAGSIAGWCDAHFNRNGSPRAGSDLARALRAEAAAAAALDAAQQAVGRLRQAVADSQDADRMMGEADLSLATLRRDSEATAALLERAAELQRAEQVHLRDAQTATEKHASFLSAESKIATLRSDIHRRTNEMVPKEARAADLAVHEQNCRSSHAVAHDHWSKDSATVRAARLRSELAAAHVKLLEKSVQWEQLRKQRDEAAALRARLAARESTLAAMAPVTAETLQSLNKRESECANAVATLEAMAAGIEVIAANVPVMVAGRLLKAGARHVLTDASEVTAGNDVRLRITPGGGTTLAAARDRVQSATDARQRELDALGLASVADAGAALAQRQQCEADMQADRAQLAGLGGDNIESMCADAANSLAAAQAELGRRSVLVQDSAEPTGLADARASAAQCRTELESAEAHETRAVAALEAAAGALEKASRELAVHRHATQEERTALTQCEIELRILLDHDGSDPARASRLADSLAAKTRAEAILAATRKSLDELQPKNLELDRARLIRASALQSDAKHEAEKRGAVAHSILQSDGTSDPHAALAHAKATTESAAAHRIVVQRKASAFALLRELFTAEQEALAEQYTGPLAEKIAAYLECVFGAGARAVVRLENNAFGGIEMIRSSHGNTAFSFDTLSRGTCEQLAAAVRLAMAEVLAEGHDGNLPVVFDDAFACSDPDRVRVLQRMLDGAARRGLQVIVLTCNPADYTGLGAHRILLGASPAHAAADESPRQDESKSFSAGEAKSADSQGRKPQRAKQADELL